MPRLKLTETVLRDGQQSLAATRMTTAEMVPILPVLDKVGFHSLEVFGGATFDTCLRHLHEDPWQRLRTMRGNLQQTKLQMLFRGQNVLGYKPYPDDIVEYFIQKSVANGIDVVRVYDALNDPRNLETAIRAAKKEKATVQAAICYTVSPAHTTESFVAYAQTLLSMGADSICIKDMAGQLKPYDAYQLIKALRAENSNMQIQLHTHTTAGLASMTVLKAVEVGVDIVDTSISPFASGASLPPTEAIVSAFLGTPYAPEIDIAALSEVTAYFAELRERYLDEGLIHRNVLKVNVDALQHQVPYGTYSTMFEKLCAMGAKNLLPEVLSEISRIRDDAGYPPLVTPISQIIGAQALQNVIDGARYKTVTEDFKSLIGGIYGRLPGTVEPMFQKSILGDELPITHRPADMFAPAVEKYRSRVAPYAEQEEDLLTLAIFEDVAIRFFEWRKNQRYSLDSRAARRFGVHPV